MSEHQFEIIKYSTEYKKDLLDLLKFLWTHLDQPDQKEFFEWRYEKNPYTQDPFIYIAIHNQKVVGCRAFVVQRFVYGKSKEIKVFSPADAIVHPQYRRKGILSRLNKAFFEDKANFYPGNKLILNLSSNQYSTPVCLKQQWKETNGIKSFCIKASLLNYILIKTGFKKVRQQENSLIKKQTYKIKITHKLKSAEISSLINHCRNPEKISNIRDADYFNWRYFYETESYTFIYYYQNNILKGYLIIKKLTDTQYKIWEYATAEPGILKRMIKAVMHQKTIPFLRSWALSADDKYLMKKCGFIAAPVKLWNFLGKKRLPVLVRPVKPEINDHDFFIDGIDIKNINNWQIFLADSH